VAIAPVALTQKPSPARAPVVSVRPPAIETQALTKKYGKITAVDGLTIRIPRGGVTGFVGPNGAGKTTTIRMLLGLVRPTSGTATVLGKPISDPPSFLPAVGALIESPAFYPPLSGRKNLEVLATLGGHDRPRVEQALKLVGLSGRAGDAYRTYSLGMKQRLGIAAALLPNPELLVLDEPTNGLDPAGIREMRELLRSLGQMGKTVFVSSHLMAEVQRLCDHLIVIRSGKLVFQGTVTALLARQTGMIVRTRDPTHLAKIVQICKEAMHVAELQEDAVLVHAPQAWAGELNVRAMRAGIVITELSPQAGDLEQTILTMTGKGGL
jgi:ABC-2 type transport system ATP-binding protein